MDHIYPPGPESVPADLTKPTTAYKHRAWLAMGGLGLFVVLYLCLAGWFVLKAYRLLGGMFNGGEANAWGIFAGLCCVFLAVFMLKALFFVKHGGTNDDLEITSAQQPRLFAFLHRLADEAGAPRPHRVFLSARVNAAVFYDLSVINLIFPSRKNLEIGLGLVNVLTLGELKAVCAHEFGHFAQRSMAVGRWVYIAQQIAGHIVAKRDALDEFLSALSRFDIRLAWIGWLLRLIVWSIRSLMDTAFTLVVLAQRALSREMEMQADLVAVSLTGSDALIHALHRLQVADDAWDRTLNFVGTELNNKRAARDVFAVQSRIIERMGTLLDNPEYGKEPVLPSVEQAAAHRLFKAELAQPPRMWSTHPHNHEREENAKRIYLPAVRDGRSAWELFDGAENLKAEVSARLIGKTEAEQVPLETTLGALDEQFEREHLKRCYRGVYYGRSVVRNVARAADLYGPLDGASAHLDSLYPESISDDLEQLANLQKEKALLETLRDGVLTAPGGVIRHRDRELKKNELPRAIAALQTEVVTLQARVSEHDQRCRTTHRAIAASIGNGWEDYLAGLAGMLHYAEHGEADLRDAQGALGNVVSVVTATRSVNKQGVERVLSAAHDVYNSLDKAFAQSGEVRLDARTAIRMKVADWPEALGKIELPPPSKENINQWLKVIDSWIGQAAGAFAALRNAALEELLNAEAEVARHHREGGAASAAPEPAKIPDQYKTLVTGKERERQKKLDWWARFQIADGIVPTLARLAVACGIVGAVLSIGGAVGDSTLTIYNGLGRTVNVEVGRKSVKVAAFASTDMQISPAEHYDVTARTADGRAIESFDVDIENHVAHQVYNVAGASPLVEWTALYGDVSPRPERMLGLTRWQTTSADLVFQEPPRQIQTSSGGGGTRQVLSGYGNEPPSQVLAMIKDEKAGAQLIATHARWDTASSIYLWHWLALASTRPGFTQLLAGRIGDDPKDVLALRFEQDAVEGPAHEAICTRHMAQARAAPGSSDLYYIAARCIADESLRDQAYVDGFKRWPRSGWLAYAAAYAQAKHARWNEALASLDIARHANPETSVVVVMDIARMRRLLAKDASPDLSDLVGSSVDLRQLLQLESGEALPDGSLRAYPELARGRLERAVELVNGTPEETRLLRLIAASDGASPALVARALALPLDKGIDDSTVWASLALAARANADTTPYADALRKIAKRDAEKILTFMESVRNRDMAAAEKSLDGTTPDIRGQAYGMGVIMLGKAAPESWRIGAKRLLFAPERPYFI